MSQRLVKISTSLQQKKYRNKYGLFVAEGEKLVLDLLDRMKVKDILCTEQWAENHQDLQTTPISEQLLKRASSLKTPTEVIALFEIPPQKPLETSQFPLLILDRIQDPGNLGTIVRTCAWFGISHIVCSTDTVDIYNPKTIQATMGALGMVSVHYQELRPLLQTLKEQDIPIYGTFMEGDNLYKTSLKRKSAIIIGNEGQGISIELMPLITKSISIPPLGTTHPESLNASISAGILCSELARIIQS